MSVESKGLELMKEDLRYMDGPWRNDACMGYAMMAMEQAGLDGDTIKRVIQEMYWCFDVTTAAEAAEHYMKG